MASFVYNAFKYSQLGDTGVTPINFKTDIIKLAILTSAYTPDQDAHDFYDDVSANEITATGSYSAGGVTLTVTTSQDNTDNEGVFDAADVAITGATITNGRYGVIYKSTGVEATSRLIALLDFTTVFATNGPVNITFAAEGIINLT